MPTARADFYIGENFKGRLDETSFWSMAAGTGGKNGIKFDNWNMVAKVLAYWQYDDSTNPGRTLTLGWTVGKNTRNLGSSGR